MKILLICGCLEPGKDGVGDYVHTLASELVLKNVCPAVLSLNDHFVSDDVTDVDIFPSLRLSSNTDWTLKLKKAKKWIDAFAPDHIVWQFVIYAFHPRGISFMPVYHVANLLKGYPKVSIMFHEIWVGAAKEDKYVDKLTGQVQKFIIKKLVRSLNPVATFTSNLTYLNLLVEHGIESKLLPLFSNIPFVPGACLGFKDYLKQRGITVPDQAVKLGVFGRIPNLWQLQLFVNQIKSLEDKLSIYIFVVGRSDQMSAAELEEIFKVKLPGVNFVNLGEQPVHLVSGFLQFIDFGIAMNSPQTIGKSGVFAAFREHGVPAIMGGADKQYTRLCNTSYELVDHLTICLGDKLDDKLKTIKRIPEKDTRAEVTNKFLKLICSEQVAEGLQSVEF